MDFFSKKYEKILNEYEQQHKVASKDSALQSNDAKKDSGKKE